MNKFFFLLSFVTSTLIAQEVCESPEASIEDLNNITKCAIENVKKKDDKTTRQISIRISAPKKRYLSKRTNIKKTVANSANNINSSGLSEMNHSTLTPSSLALKSAINPLSNNLSSEEVKKASKFTEVDHIPSFYNCESDTSSKELACFNNEMIKHIEKHFSYPKAAIINKIEGKVWIRFIITSEGAISNIKTLGPVGGEVLKEEAKRVISRLPIFNPSTKNGQKIAVKYGFPIEFSLE